MATAVPAEYLTTAPIKSKTTAKDLEPGETGYIPAEHFHVAPDRIAWLNCDAPLLEPSSPIRKIRILALERSAGPQRVQVDLSGAAGRKWIPDAVRPSSYIPVQSVGPIADDPAAAPGPGGGKA